MQRTTHEIRETVDDHLRIATARLEVCECNQAGGDIGIQDGLGQRDDAIRGGESQKLLDVGDSEGFDAR